MIKKLFILSRPRFWLYVLGPYLLGVIATHAWSELKNLQLWYGFFYFLLPANLFIYTVNDYFDRDIDRHNPKKMQQESAMKSEDSSLYISVIILCLLAGIPLLLSGLIPAAALFIFLLIGFFYSSPPLRLKTKPVYDSVSNFFYIIPGVISYSIVTQSLPPLPILLSGSLWAIAMHLFSAVVDIIPDRKSGISTTATLLGYKYAMIATGVLWLLSLLLVIPYSNLLLIGIIYPLLPFLILWKKYPVDRAYWVFPYLNAAIGFGIFCILVLHG